MRAAPALLAAAVALGVPAAAQQPAAPPAPAANEEAPPVDRIAAQFERLKSLAGTWHRAGSPGHGLRIEFRTTAGGTVLIEEWIFEGRPHSLTLYHRDGATLLATHYCPQGNQPRLALVEGGGDGDGHSHSDGDGDGDTLRFAFRDATDLDPAIEQYQHDLALAWDDAGHLIRSEIYRDGEGGVHPSQLVLERMAEPAR